MTSTPDAEYLASKDDSSGGEDAAKQSGPEIKKDRTKIEEAAGRQEKENRQKMGKIGRYNITTNPNSSSL